MDLQETNGGKLRGEMGEFTSTHWSVVLAASEQSSAKAQQALEKLCARYWYPLYVYVRRQGHGPHDAQDLTQGFFAHLLSRDFLHGIGPQKGRFRSFLLVCLKNFLSDQWDKLRAKKRGSGQLPFSLDEESAEKLYHLEPAETMEAERLYERRWALTLLDGVLDRLHQEFTAAGKGQIFDELQHLLLGEKTGVTYGAVAAKTGSTEGAIKMTAHRMRQRYRELLREEIAQTVASPEEVDEEIRYLFSLLSG